MHPSTGGAVLAILHDSVRFWLFAILHAKGGGAIWISKPGDLLAELVRIVLADSCVISELDCHVHYLQLITLSVSPLFNGDGGK